jgi:WD40 repeat protein
LVRDFGIAHEGPVTCLCLSFDGKFLFSAGGDRRLKCWDVGRGELWRDYGPVFKGEIRAMAFLKRFDAGR